MDRKNLLKWIAILMVLIYGVDRLGGFFHWYYTIWWFDMLTHFSGGLWVGLFFVYFFSRKDLNFNQIFWVLSGLLLFSVAWEIFEFYVHNVIEGTPFSIIDTTSDLCFDFAGGLVAIAMYFKHYISEINKI